MNIKIGHTLLATLALLHMQAELIPWKFLHSLKVVGNEKEGGGSRRWQMIGIGLKTAAIEVCLHYNFAVLFDFMYFRFRPSKAK